MDAMALSPHVLLYIVRFLGTYCAIFGVGLQFAIRIPYLKLQGDVWCPII